MKTVPVLVGGGCAAALLVSALIPATAHSERTITALFSLFAASYVVVGAVVSARRPSSPLGWLMLGVGALSSAAVLLGAYAGYALFARPGLPRGEFAA